MVWELRASSCGALIARRGPKVARQLREASTAEACWGFQVQQVVEKAP
ncbi:MAG: hypothetical protein VKM34_02405 [Cyanobacteriota bacterium]|nr:hypothetical protein [Cyanobacteriota bacterium]